MARLSDFQRQPAGRNFAAEALCDNNAKRMHAYPDWKRTHIDVREGSMEIYGRDAVAPVLRSQKIHRALDQILCHNNQTSDDAVRLHRALDRLLDDNPNASILRAIDHLLDAGAEKNEKHKYVHIPANNESDEPEASDSDEEPQEANDDDLLGRIQRQLDALAKDHDAELKAERTNMLLRQATAQIVASHKRKVSRAVNYATDSEMIQAFFPQAMLCRDAAAKIYDRAYREQVTSPQRHYWSGLVAYLKNQKKDARIQDCNPVTLSSYLSRTLAA